jgi:parallel beta-helix repeat protein
VKLTPGSSGYINHSNISFSANGVNLFGTNNIRITNCSIHDVNFGVKLDPNSDNNLIDSNQIYNCDTGIGMYDSDNNIIFNNSVNNSSVSGISISDSASNNEIKSNYFYNSTGRGISLSGNAHNNSFISNEIYLHALDGIRATNAKDNVFEYNQIYSNKKNGIILFFGSERCVINHNTITQNTLDGLSLEGLRSGEVRLNEIIGNGIGVAFDNSSGIELENNTIVTSTNADIFLTDFSYITSVNCTFNPSKVIVYDLSKFYVYWHMFLETRDEANAIIPANVNITNSSSGIIVPATDIAGTLDWILCLGSIYTSYGQDNTMNPYWVRADNGSKVLKLGFDLSQGSKTCVVKFVYYPPPESTLPTSFDFKEDNSLEINISHYFTSSEELEYDIKRLTGDKIHYAFYPDTTILRATPPSNWYGEERMRITAIANLGGELPHETKIIVTSVNDKPFINKSLPSFQKPEDTIGWEVNISSYASDYDLKYGDSLRWSVSGVNESLLNVTVTGQDDLLKFELKDDNVFGDDELKVTVKDSANASDFQYIWVNITPENDPPRLTVPFVIPASGTPGTYFNFTVKYSDIDGDLPNFIVLKLDDKDSYQMLELDDSDLNVMDGKEYYFLLTLHSGSHFFWVECSDGNGELNITPKQTGPLVTIADKGSLKGTVMDKESLETLPEVNITMFSFYIGFRIGEVT